MVAISRIEAHEVAHDSGQVRSTSRRFDHVLITSVFGDPLHPRTWSGAPLNLAMALSRLASLSPASILTSARLKS